MTKVHQNNPRTRLPIQDHAIQYKKQQIQKTHVRTPSAKQSEHHGGAGLIAQYNGQCLSRVWMTEGSLSTLLPSSDTFTRRCGEQDGQVGRGKQEQRGYPAPYHCRPPPAKIIIVIISTSIATLREGGERRHTHHKTNTFAVVCSLSGLRLFAFCFGSRCSIIVVCALPGGLANRIPGRTLPPRFFVRDALIQFPRYTYNVVYDTSI